LKKPKHLYVLNAIDWLDDQEGNARYTQLLQIFCRVFDCEEDAPKEVLDELEMRKLIMRDGYTHRGRHLSLTPPGKQKISYRRRWFSDQQDAA
jgi:hypothetical protein